MRFLRTHQGKALGFYLSAVISAAAHAADPSQLAPVTFPSTGGDSISGSGEWSIIADGDTQKCDLNFYRLNFETMAWEFFQVVNSGNTNFCNRSSFGDSASLTGNVLVVGGPEYDGGQGAQCDRFTDAGAIILFIFDGAQWVRYDTGNQQSCGQGTIFRSDNPAATEAFGSSVSVSQNSDLGSENLYLVAVGAPGYDDGSNTDAGRIYTLEFDTTANTLTQQGFLTGSQPSEAMGFSVTTNHPYALAGAPGYDNAGDADAGRLVVVDGIAGGAEMTIQDEFFGAIASEFLGGEVSFSDSFLLGAGATQALVVEGAPPSYTATPILIPPFDGDVSQSSGVAALGKNENGSDPGGATIYPNIVIDDTTAGTGDGVAVDLNGIVSATDMVGFDIRLVDEFLWFADPDNSRAFHVAYPCGYGTWLEADVWTMVSITCEVAGQTIGDVFDANIDGNRDDSSFEIFAIDDTKANSNDPYLIPIQADTVDQGRSYWVKVTQSQYFAIPDTVSTAFTSTTALPATTAGPAPPASVRRFREEILPAPVGGANGFARIMVANPYNRPFQWNELFYQNGADITRIDQQATKIKPYGFLYDPVNGVGQPYVPLTNTPGLGGTVPPGRGFWIQVEGDSGAVSNGGTLLVPLTD